MACIFDPKLGSSSGHNTRTRNIYKKLQNVCTYKVFMMW